MMNIKALKNKNRQAFGGEAVSNKVPCSIININQSWLKLKRIAARKFTLAEVLIAFTEAAIEVSVIAVLLVLVGVLHV